MDSYWALFEYHFEIRPNPKTNVGCYYISQCSPGRHSVFRTTSCSKLSAEIPGVSTTLMPSPTAPDKATVDYR